MSALALTLQFVCGLVIGASAMSLWRKRQESKRREKWGEKL